MKANPETTALLRETLEKYVRDLAEELLYWVEEMNKLDAGEIQLSDTETVAEEWPVQRGVTPPDEGSTQSSGKGI